MPNEKKVTKSEEIDFVKIANLLAKAAELTEAEIIPLIDQATEYLNDAYNRITDDVRFLYKLQGRLNKQIRAAAKDKTVKAYFIKFLKAFEKYILNPKIKLRDDLKDLKSSVYSINHVLDARLSTKTINNIIKYEISTKIKEDKEINKHLELLKDTLKKAGYKGLFKKL